MRLPGDPAAAKEPERAHRARRDPRRRADLTGRDLTAGRDLEADRLACARVPLGTGLVREAARAPDGPATAPSSSSRSPEAALVLGLDLGARFLRGALCDLADVRARQDVELTVAAGQRRDRVPRPASGLSSDRAASTRPDRQRRHRGPRRCRAGERASRLATNVPGSRAATSAARPGARSGSR